MGKAKDFMATTFYIKFKSNKQHLDLKAHFMEFKPKNTDSLLATQVVTSFPFKV